MRKKRKDPAAVALGRKGGRARTRALTAERRSEIARLGALATNAKLAEKRAAELAEEGRS